MVSAVISPRWDLRFRTGTGGALNPGDTITIDFPTTTVFNAPGAANIWLSTSDWTMYPYDNAAVPGVVNPSAISTSGTRLILTIPAGFTVPDGGICYVRIDPNVISNPNTPGSYALQVFTSKQTNPTSSNYYGVSAIHALAGGTSVTTTFPAVMPPKLYPQTAGSISQVDIGMVLNYPLTTVGPNPRTVTMTFPLGFTIPTYINPGDIYVASNVFLNCYDGSGNPTPPATFMPLTIAPTIVGNTITIQLPAGLTPAFGSYLQIQFRPAAGIRNPSTSGTTYTISNINIDGNDGPYGAATESEYFSVTPATNIAGASSIQTDKIIFGSTGYYTSGNINPSRVEVIGNKTLRIYLPLGYTISASATSTITFLAAAHLRNTCTPGNYIIRMRTSKDQDFIDSQPYAIVAAVKDITVRAVPPIVSTIANYTIVLTDTSTSGLKKDRDTITIAFPTETVIPATMSPGSIYIARTADFTNDTCPPTHPGTYGVHWAPLSAPPVISGSTVTLTVPININPGELISIRFCASAGITNPGYAKYYTLQVMTSAQPQFAVSKPYPIISGLNRPKVVVTPNIISRTPNCQQSTHTITFKTGVSGALTKGTSRIYVAMQLANVATNPGYFNPPAMISANCIKINGTQSTANANIIQNPLQARV